MNIYKFIVVLLVLTFQLVAIKGQDNLTIGLREIVNELSQNILLEGEKVIIVDNISTSDDKTLCNLIAEELSLVLKFEQGEFEVIDRYFIKKYRDRNGSLSLFELGQHFNSDYLIKGFLDKLKIKLFFVSLFMT